MHPNHRCCGLRLSFLAGTLGFLGLGLSGGTGTPGGCGVHGGRFGIGRFFT